MTFRVGMKVTMIKPHVFQNMQADEVQPRFGEVYTVIEVREWVADCPALVFQEIRNPPNYEGREAAFDGCEFRPIVDKKTDIGFAHEILRKASRTKVAVT